MTGIEIYRNTYNLLGRNISAADNICDNGDIKNILSAIGRVVSDLTDKPCKITSLNQEIQLGDLQCEALPYGVAMFLTLMEGDIQRHAFFTDIYNKKRTRAKSSKTTVVDIMQYGG